MKRVAIGGLHTECSTYNPLLQADGDFEVAEGDALRDAVPHLARRGLEVVPLLHARSVPGGPVAPETWARLSGALLSRLRAALPLDGALLLMHGAVAVPGLPDPEGDLIAEARRILGPDAVLAASFDLHGHVTERIASALDIFCAYRTAPHIDVDETHARAARLLVDALEGGPRPQVVWSRIPVLASGEMTATRIEPCRSLYAAMPGIDARPGLLDANLMIGYVWADVARAGASAVVTCTDGRAGRAAADEIAASYAAARGRFRFEMDALPLDAALDACDGPSVLADSGDNPTGGGVGDRADVLEALLRAGRPALVAGIADPPAVEALANGARRIETGGSLGGGGPRLALDAEACEISQGSAVIRKGAVTLVLTARRRPFHRRADFDALGIELERHPLLVVKSGYLVPEIAALPRRQIMALTAGAVSQDVRALENRHRPRGTYPFDPMVAGVGGPG